MSSYIRTVDSYVMPVKRNKVSRIANNSVFRKKFRRRGLPLRSIGRYSRSDMSGVPSKMFVKLRYAQLLTSTAAGVNDQDFRLNSLFDPDAEGAGQQPQGFDELSALYTRYRVYACKTRVTYVNNDSDTVEVITLPSTGATDYSDIQDALTAPRAKSTTLTATGGSKDRVIHSHYVNIKKSEGWDGNVQDLSAGVTASPSLLWYLHCITAQADASAVNVDMKIEMTFYCKFFDPKKLGIS